MLSGRKPCPWWTLPQIFQIRWSSCLSDDWWSVSLFAHHCCFINLYSWKNVQAQELLANIAALEITVSKLEEELVLLQFRLSRERTERHHAENSLNILPVVSPKPPESGLPGYTWEEVPFFPHLRLLLTCHFFWISGTMVMMSILSLFYFTAPLFFATVKA